MWVWVWVYDLPPLLNRQMDPDKSLGGPLLVPAQKRGYLGTEDSHTPEGTPFTKGAGGF